MMLRFWAPCEAQENIGRAVARCTAIGHASAHTHSLESRDCLLCLCRSRRLVQANSANGPLKTLAILLDSPVEATLQMIECGFRDLFARCQLTNAVAVGSTCD